MTEPAARDVVIPVSERIGEVDGRVVAPAGATLALVLAHGAGAGMRHEFLEAMADFLAARGVATLRYQFPSMQAGASRPDPPEVAHAAVRAAVAAAARELPGMRLLAGGKSFGGRMTSQAAAREALPGVSGIVFLGFPLHVAKAPSVARAEHLQAVPQPMLFLQGTRDALAEIDLVRGVVARLGPRATLEVFEGADHGFDVLKRSGRTRDEVRGLLADAIVSFAGAAG